MGTKLEALIEVLKDSVEQEVIDKLVLDYFNNQYSSKFETDDQEYEVLSKSEKYDQLYDIAEELFYDYQEVLEGLIKYSNSDRTQLTTMINTLSEPTCSDAIADNLDFEEELNKVLIGYNRDYFVYINE